MDNIAEKPAVPILNVSKARIILGIVFAIVFPLVLSAWVSGSSLSYEHKVYYSRFIFWAEVGLLWLFAKYVEKQNLLLFTEKKSGVAFIISSIGILYVIVFGAQILSSIPQWFGYHEDNAILKQIAAAVKGHPMLIILISLTAGFTEEMIFRAYVLTRLSQLTNNKVIPVIISSLAFSLLHYKYHSPREYIFAFLFGVIMSVHYQRYGNIKPLIIVHFLVDVVGLTLATHFLK